MGTTTIRVDSETHAQLVEMSQLMDTSLIDTVRQAAEALSRRRFAERVAGELGRLRDDSDAWKDYVSEAELTSVRDGVD